MLLCARLRIAKRTVSLNIVSFVDAPRGGTSFPYSPILFLEYVSCVHSAAIMMCAVEIGGKLFIVQASAAEFNARERIFSVAKTRFRRSRMNRRVARIRGTVLWQIVLLQFHSRSE
jgi:hypothetical protein